MSAFGLLDLAHEVWQAEFVNASNPERALFVSLLAVCLLVLSAVALLAGRLAYLLLHRPAPRPGPYALDDPEQDGPAWQPTPEERAAILRDYQAERIEEQRAEIVDWLEGHEVETETDREAAMRLLRRLPESVQREIADEAERRGRP